MSLTNNDKENLIKYYQDFFKEMIFKISRVLTIDEVFIDNKKYLHCDSLEMSLFFIELELASKIPLDENIISKFITNKGMVEGDDKIIYNIKVIDIDSLIQYLVIMKMQQINLRKNKNVK